MKKATREHYESLPKCKGCGIPYNSSNVAREYGRESKVYLGGYHSAACYTDSTTKNQLTPIDKNGLIEICGSVIPIHELERVWKVYCTLGSPLNLKAENEKLIKDKAELLELVIETKGKWFFDHVADDGLLDKLRAAITKHSS